jgi:cytosine/adenosine deaminase-related metal-dependent hydrolase
VLADYGWAHSLGIDGDERVRQSHRATPPQTPWFIHSGEGVDEAARQEFPRLEALGCVTANARFVHGVAFGAADLETIARAGAGLIWCPASNLYLFGRTAAVSTLAARERVALGSDSRLSGSLDLLAEVREAHGTGLVPEDALESLVTKAGASLLGLLDRGELRAGALADLVILPRGMPLWRATRTDLRCVMLGGAMSCGDQQLAAQLMRAEDRTRIVVDGADKVLRTGIAETLRHHGVDESGVQGLLPAGRAA